MNLSPTKRLVHVGDTVNLTESIQLPAHDREAWENFFGGAPGCVSAR